MDKKTLSTSVLSLCPDFLPVGLARSTEWEPLSIMEAGCLQVGCLPVTEPTPSSYWRKSKGLTPVTNQISAVAETGNHFATIDMGQKVVGLLWPFPWGELGPHLAMLPGPRPTSIPSGILTHPTVWPQYTNITDRQTDRQTDTQDNGPVA